MPFKYKRILLIGATSGIGEALAERFIQEGSYVIAAGRRKQNLAKLVEKAGHEKAAAVPFDISELDKIPNFVQNITSTYPDLDCVFINSGIQRDFDFTKPDTVDLSLFQTELLTNYTSYVALTTAFLPFLLKASHDTSLIYTSSGLAIVPITPCPGYCASKAALHHFILTLRSQLNHSDGGKNIKVLEVLPPRVQTDLQLDGEKAGMPLGEFTDEAYERLATGEETILVGKRLPSFTEAEKLRQEAFHQIDAMMRGESKSNV